MSLASRVGRQRSAGTTLLGVFLVVTLALSCWFALEAWTSVRSHRETAEAVLRDYARIASSEYADEASDGFSELFDVAFDEIPRVDRNRRLPPPSAVAEEMDDAARSLSCACPDLRKPIAVFREDLATGTVVAEPDTVPAALLSAFTAAIADHRRQDPAARYGVLLPTPAEPGVLLAYAVVRNEPGVAVAVYGVAAHERALAELAAAWLDDDLLPSAIARDLPNDSLLSVAVYGPDGRAMFVSPVSYPSTLSARDSLGHAFGDLVVEASIRPDAAGRLVIGGLPGSRLPVFLGLLLLTLSVGAAGLLQVRRHHELSRLREDFISSVSHELRTPLTQIRMLAELQEEGKLRTEEERVRSTKVIRREAQRLTQLVENILQFSRLRATTDDVAASRPVKLADAVPEAIASFTPLASANGASVSVFVEKDLAVLAQREGVRRIVSNLLDNALKYGPAGQTIRVRAERAVGFARISVEDQGPGIPVEERERIWEPYRRLPRDVDAGRPGSGVGLAVVHALVRQYGGRARVEDAAPTGSRFVVELPLSESEEPSPAAARGAIATAGV